VSDLAASLQGLTRTFGSITAVDGLTLTVEQGELFGIVGPDGAGKTTTLRMLAGVLRPTSGEVRVAGVDVGAEPEAVKHHIAYMAQRFGLYEDLTVAENIDFYSDLYRVPRTERPARLERLYAFSRLGEFRDRLAGNLSGGMKQKLSLSCCLVHHPKVLLLDEPTFGVDPISRRELWLILHEMVSEGVTIIVSTAYLDEAERCDRVVMMHEGRALALDRPVALQSSMGGSMLSLRTDRPREARDLLRQTPEVESAALFGETVHALLPSGSGNDAAVRALTAGGISVLNVDTVQPSLEDVFIHLVSSEMSEDGPRA
jgi:ABC-2 type transport system ATP-binding protein